MNVQVESVEYTGPDRRKVRWHEKEHVSWGLIAAILMQAAIGLWWLKGLSDEVKHLAISYDKRFSTVEQRVNEQRTNGLSRAELEAMFALRDLQLQHHATTIGEIKQSLKAIETGVNQVAKIITRHETRTNGNDE